MGEPDKQARNLIDLAMASSLGQITALEGLCFIFYRYRDGLEPTILPSLTLALRVCVGEIACSVSRDDGVSEEGGPDIANGVPRLVG